MALLEKTRHVFVCGILQFAITTIMRSIWGTNPYFVDPHKVDPGDQRRKYLRVKVGYKSF